MWLFIKKIVMDVERGWLSAHSYAEGESSIISVIPK